LPDENYSYFFLNERIKSQTFLNAYISMKITINHLKKIKKPEHN
jgi:hypothetical protein